MLKIPKLKRQVLVVLAGGSPGVSRQGFGLHVSLHDRFSNESQTHLSTVHLTLITHQGLSTTLARLKVNRVLEVESSLLLPADIIKSDRHVPGRWRGDQSIIGGEAEVVWIATATNVYSHSKSLASVGLT